MVKLSLALLLVTVFLSSRGNLLLDPGFELTSNNGVNNYWLSYNDEPQFCLDGSCPYGDWSRPFAGQGYLLFPSNLREATAAFQILNFTTCGYTVTLSAYVKTYNESVVDDYFWIAYFDLQSNDFVYLLFSTPSSPQLFSKYTLLKTQKQMAGCGPGYFYISCGPNNINYLIDNVTLSIE